VNPVETLVDDTRPPALPAAAPRRRVDAATLGVVAALVLVAGAWFGWARLTAPLDSGRSWGPLDSILAASADRQRDQPAPTFTTTDASGQSISLEDLRGQVVLLNFWATWCAPCRAEMPELDAVAEAHRDAGFQVLAINVLEDAEAVRRFGKELNLNLPLLLDREGTIYRAYNVQGMPTSFLVDRDGVIRDVRYGVVSRGALERRLATLLAPAETS
jgi:peroxiredoxin